MGLGGFGGRRGVGRRFGEFHYLSICVLIFEYYFVAVGIGSNFLLPHPIVGMTNNLPSLGAACYPPKNHPTQAPTKKP